MLIYFLRRLALAISVLFAALVTTFVVFFVGPSDPAGALCARSGRECKPAQLESYKRALGLDKPKSTQFLEYVKGIFVGQNSDTSADAPVKRVCPAPCIGYSYVENRPVMDMVKDRFPVTLSIAIGGIVVYVVLGLTAGTFAAKYRGRLPDRIIVFMSQVIPAVPYYIGALLYYLYFMRLNAILPLSKYTPISEDPVAWFVGLSAVWAFYGTYAATGWVRWIRSFMIDVQNSDYVRTARSKGISESAVTIKHALRAAIPPFVTMLGLSIAGELGGAIFTERIFALPGMGNLALDAFSKDDLPVISGVVLMTAFFVTMGNLIVDMIQGLLDPRVKLS